MSGQQSQRSGIIRAQSSGDFKINFFTQSKESLCIKLRKNKISQMGDQVPKARDPTKWGKQGIELVVDRLQSWGRGSIVSLVLV